MKDNQILSFKACHLCSTNIRLFCHTKGEKFMRDLHTLQGKTIGVVYTYEGEEAPGFFHYHVWQSDIISNWLTAIQDLKCRPFIIDVRTFVEKAIAGSLPDLDFVLNLNCGGYELSPMALIPSVCGFFNIPCIPCNASTILAGENKRISNLLASTTGLQVPPNLKADEDGGIFRPLNLGSSIGIKRGPLSGDEPDGLYQKFISGYDITTPIVFNPYTNKMVCMPTVLYMPEEDSTDWYLGESYKDTRSGFERKSIFELSTPLESQYLELVKNMDINTFCRIDARIACTSKKQLFAKLQQPLLKDDVYFIEINPMPTVWINNAFSHSYNELSEKHNLYPYIQNLNELVERKINLYSFLLSIAMSSFYSHVQK